MNIQNIIELINTWELVQRKNEQEYIVWGKKQLGNIKDSFEYADKSRVIVELEEI